MNRTVRQSFRYSSGCIRSQPNEKKHTVFPVPYTFLISSCLI